MKPPGLLRVVGYAALAALLGWLVLAYLVLPRVWHVYEKRHPALADAPRLTHTAAGIPGDLVNVALVATEGQIHRALLAAHWVPADPITVKTALRIAGSAVLHRPYPDAPVSSLYLWGHRQDLAYEQPLGGDARSRHHVRFWCSGQRDAQGRPLWLGAATLDLRVGFSHRTGELTHHIAADVDAERDKVIADLRGAGWLPQFEWIDAEPVAGRNGEGDPYRSDGRLAEGVIVEAGLTPVSTSIP